MRKYIIVFIVSFILGASVMAFANNTGTQRSLEYILNRVWNTTNNTINIKGV